MAEEKKTEGREIIVPLRKGFWKTPKYRRAPKAIKILKKFIARHMKIYDRDLKKIKIDKYLNEEMWFRGIQKPLHKIKVKVKKIEDKIMVELAEIPQIVKFKIEREKKSKEAAEKKKIKEKEKEEKPEEKKEEKSAEEKIEEKEKEKSTVEAGLKQAEEKHKEMKHETKMSKQPKRQIRQALQK